MWQEHVTSAVLSAMSIMLDAANELFHRMSLYAEKRDKDYNELLTKYREQLSVTTLVSPRSVSDCASAIETQIDGDYNGWDDEVIYKMTNGQILAAAQLSLPLPLRLSTRSCDLQYQPRMPLQSD
jgi:hypothetical protein